MPSEYILILIVSILPLLHKYSFWLYVIQLKEYRLDRYRDYISTPQGRSAVFNFWFFIEAIIFTISLGIIYDESLQFIVYPVLFYFLVIQNLFVIGKIARKTLLKPKITFRLLTTILIIFATTGGFGYYIIADTYYTYFYSYILGILLFPSIVIFIGIVLSLPIVVLLKNQTIKHAEQKSKNIKKTIKIGITGSYGKSSIKEYLSSILQAEGKTLKTPENQNTELGVAKLILAQLNHSYQYFVAEMGAYKRGEIEVLGNIVNHKHAILTSIGTQHVGLFGGIENTKLGKAEIAYKVKKNKGTLYINWENENIRSIDFDPKLKITKYGNQKGSDVKYKIIEYSAQHTKFILKYQQKTYTFTTNLIGEHNILNISGVIALCIDLGIPKSSIKKSLLSLTTPQNTLSTIHTKKYTLINDSYNLSENGAIAGIEILKNYQGNKILVIDDISELGKESKTIHINLGKKIAIEKKVNQVFYVGTNFGKYFERGLREGGFDTKNILSSLENIPKKSIILFEGRHSKKYLDNIIKNA